MTKQWVSVSMRTGAVVQDLPTLEVPEVSAVLGSHTTTSATLDLSGRVPGNWLEATDPMACALLLLDDDTPGGQEVALWGGPITRRRRPSSGIVPLALTSWEGYLLRRNVPDLTFTGVEQTAMVSALVSASVADGTVPLVIETVPGAQVRTKAYKDSGDKKVLTALTELMGLLGGPEWTVVWRRVDGAPVRWVPVLRVADRIGTPVPAGMAPAVTFDLPGSVTAFDIDEDWTDGRGATRVIATSAPDGNTRTQSPPQESGDPLRPTIEHRWSPSTSIETVGTLTEHAAAALALMRDGATSVSLTAANTKGRRLGVDWSLGDDIGYAIEAPAFTGSGTARAIGWTLRQADDTVTPILASEVI